MSKEEAKQLYQKAAEIEYKSIPNVSHEATVLFEKAFQLDPEFWKAASALGNSLRREREFDCSIEVIQKAISDVSKSTNLDDFKKNKTLKGLTAVLGSTYFDAGRYEEAARLFQQHLEIEYNLSGAIDLGGCYVKMGLYQKAIDLLSQFEELGQQQFVPDLLLYLGQAYKGVGQIKRAEGLFRTYFNFIPTDPDVKTELESLGLKVVKQGDTFKLLSEGEKVSKSGCFIATAVYGSEDVEEVLILRTFRDEFLSALKIGRWFINIYYFTSPPLARLIGFSLILRELARWILLEPAIKIVTAILYRNRLEK